MMAICPPSRLPTAITLAITASRIAMVIANSQRVWDRFHQEGLLTTETSFAERSRTRKDCGTRHKPPLRMRQMHVMRSSLFNGLEVSAFAGIPAGNVADKNT